MWLKAQRHFSLCPPAPSVIKREPMTTLQPYEYQGKYPGWQILVETQMAYVRRRMGEKKVKLASVLFWGRCEILILIDENVFDLKKKQTLLVNRKWWGAVRLLVLASVLLNREHLTILTFCLLTSSCSFSSLPKCTVATAGGDHPYFCLPVLLIKKCLFL